jgi:phosphoribosylaminoimidazole-succinocarboxamide synthase
MLLETQLPNLLHRGKVRDTYLLNDAVLLMVATDRISAFDVVLPTGIPDKGLVLNRMSAFWFHKTRHLVPNHFLALADEPDVLSRFGSAFGGLADLPPEIARQAMMVQRAQRIDIECIVRGYITGSAWSEYRSQGTVWGKPQPAGLLEGQAFPEPLFTPTNKAEEGHDQNMTEAEVLDLVGPQLARQLEQVSKTIYRFAQDYARTRGIILADTKMEFGLMSETPRKSEEGLSGNRNHGQLILIDELLTPDSSRFWDREQYQPGRSLPNFDKQYVRDWLTAQGWDRKPPAPQLPEDVVARTSERYRDAYRRITGERL